MSRPVVILDPGHGDTPGWTGFDPGACSGTVTEASRALDMALTIKGLLVADFDVRLTRDGTKGGKPDLQERIKLVERTGAVAFVSLHWDMDMPKHRQGVYYAPGMPSILLAKRVAEEMRRLHRDRGAPWVSPSSSSRFRGLYIDGVVDAKPSILVEFDSVRHAPPSGPLGKAERLALAVPLVNALRATFLH